MLSYRHGFHAGNTADVFKHSVLFSFLTLYTKKGKPFTAFDLNGGAGTYNLLSEWSLQTGEAEEGIIRILNLYEENKLPKPIPEDFKNYLSFCRENYKKDFSYLGSPEIMRSFLTKESNLIVVDLHTAESENLKKLYKNIANVHVHKRDYCEAFCALTPPSSHRREPIRGFALFDPSYEVTSDYENIAYAIEKARNCWQAGIFLIWYPILARRKTETEKLKKRLRSLKKTPILNFEVMHHFCTLENSTVETENYGLQGSGIMIVNPPWGLEEKIKEIAAYMYRLEKAQ